MAALRIGAAMAATAIALTGCVRATVDTEITTDGTFSQHTVVAVSETALDQLLALPQASQLPADLDLSTLLDDAASAPGVADLEERYPGKVTVADYDDDELEGIEITVTDLPIDEFSIAGEQLLGGLGGGATLDRVEGDYVVTMTPPAGLDLGAAGLTESNLSLIESSVDIAVTFTFPGLVEEASAGEVEGKSVTLGLTDIASGEEIVIVAGADTAIDWGPWLKWGGLTLAFILVIGGAAALVIDDRRKRSRSTLPPPQATEDPSGPGMLGQSDEPQPPEDGATPPRD